MVSSSVPIIEVSGPPRERGRAYGEAARAEIARSLEYYRQAFAVSPGLDWGQVVVRARAWRPVVYATAPHLLAEMDGIAEGAGTTADDVLALNARGEIARSADSRFAAAGSEEWPVDGCSAFALLPDATADGHVYCGQNWDWREGTEDTTVMLRIVQPPRPTVVMQVEAGQVGRHGVNSAGLALNANGLDGAFGAPIGAPQPVLRRMVLDSTTLRDALDVPFAVHQHIATNLLFTHRDGIAVDLETTPLGHRWGYGEDGVLVHGNHYQYGVPAELEPGYRPSSPDSLYRVPVIRRGLAGARHAGGSAGVRKIVHETMSDHAGHPLGVCCHARAADSETGRYKTMMSSLVDLTAGEYRVLRGNPCEGEYMLLPWDLADGPGGDR